MKIVRTKISVKELNKMSKRMFEDLVKAVVDVEKQTMAVDAAMHTDEEVLLIKNGSKQKNLWGINLYPKEFGNEKFVEFDSVINIRPFQENRSRGVENKKMQIKIQKIVNKLVTK